MAHCVFLAVAAAELLCWHGICAAVGGGPVAPDPEAVSRSIRFFVARHGQTTFNAQKRFQGSLDEAPVLTEKGVAQAQVLGSWVRQEVDMNPVDAVFVSPLRRARQTLDEVKKVAGDLPEEMVLSDLREIDLYEWEGRTQPEIGTESPELLRMWKERAWDLRLGADSPSGARPVVADLWARAASAWGQMREVMGMSGHTQALVVAHGTLGKALLSTALGLPEQAFRHFQMKNGEVVEVLWPAGSVLGEASWRRRHPVQGSWLSGKDEAAIFATGSVCAGEAEAV